MAASDIEIIRTRLENASRLDLLKMEKLLQIRKARLDFALNHHKNTKGESMDFAAAPHIHGFYNSLAPYIVIMGSVQSMKSEWCIIDHFACAYVGLSVFFVLPKYEMRSSYVQNRIDRCIEKVDMYKTLIGSGFFDNVSMKHFHSGVIKYVGSNVLADFKEFPGDVLFVEEVDQCDADNVEYGGDRLRASKFQFKRYIGNPTFKGVGIHKYFLLSDQREWEVPCLNCGEYSEMNWFECIVRTIFDGEGQAVDYVLRDTEWYIGCKRDIRCICPKCNGQLDRFSKEGRWTPKNNFSSMEGYHVTMLTSPYNAVASMWERFQLAIHDQSRMQQFYNSDLGLPYEAIGSKLTEDVLSRCSTVLPEDERYNFVVEGTVGHIENDNHPGPCAMGVDVGGNFDVKISHVDGNGKRKAVFIGKVKSPDEVVDIAERYHVEVGVIDSLPEARISIEIQDMCAQRGIDIWLCKYGSEGNDRRPQKDLSHRNITVDRTIAMDRAFSKLKGGKMILPMNFRSICSGEYTKEMCGPIRQLETDAKGNTKYIWGKCKDHSRHADVYELLAAEMLVGNVLSGVTVV